jgi:hypothetical protein
VIGTNERQQNIKEVINYINNTKFLISKEALLERNPAEQYGNLLGKILYNLPNQMPTSIKLKNTF